ncbi:MAG: hypothetical protein ACFE9L_05265 [Candidatus Hodarchaeota archaeon]
MNLDNMTLRELHNLRKSLEQELKDLRKSRTIKRNSKKDIYQQSKIKSRSISLNRRELDTELIELKNQLNQLTAEIQNLSDQIIQKQRELRRILVEVQSRFDQWINNENGQIRHWKQDTPLLLFPCRIETKYEKKPNSSFELLVRVYPDTISISTHEELLTQQELLDGERIITQIWWAGCSKPVDDKDWILGDEPIDEETRESQNRRLAAWRELSSKYGNNRAYWILKIVYKDYLLEKSSTERKSPTQPIELDLDGNPNETHSFDEPLFTPLESVLLRPESWSEAPRSHVLPDFFVFLFYPKKGNFYQKIGNIIPNPLNVGPEPFRMDPVDPNIPFFDITSKWIVDFDEAVNLGMGVRITELEIPELRKGFDKIVIIGLQVSKGQEESVDAVKDLLFEHNYTRGFEFLKQGTPTNNLPGFPSGHKRKRDSDEFFMNSFKTEIDLSLSEEMDPQIQHLNGPRLAWSLGMDDHNFGQIFQSELSEYFDAGCMNRVLWNGTLGYFMETLMSNELSNSFFWTNQHLGIGGTLIFMYHSQFFLRGRGPLGTIKIGDNPYGILPVSSIEDWQHSSIDSYWMRGKEEVVGLKGEGVFNELLPDILKRLYPFWQQMAKSPLVPRVGNNDDTDEELLRLLQKNPISRHIKLRPYIDIIYIWMLLLWFPGVSILPNWVDGLLELVGFRSTRSNAAYFWNEYRDRVETEKKKFDDLHAENPRLYPELIPSLLAMFSWGNGLLMTPYYRIYLEIIHGLSDPIGNPLVTSEPISETDPLPVIVEDQNYLQWLGDDSQRTSIDYFNGIEGENGPDSFLYHLVRHSIMLLDANNKLETNRHSLRPYKYINRLAKLPTAELERLLGETLDISSHRLDAWITSLAAKRLENLRIYKHDGLLLGSYGWVENLPPATELPIPSHGYIMAPSVDQSIAGATLFSGHVANVALGNEDTMTIRLTSDRVRNGLWLWNGIKNGLPLKALLGDRFENGLHENYGENSTNTLEMDQYIYHLRKLYSQDQSTEEIDGDQTSIDNHAASYVVDGLKLLKAYQKDPSTGGDIPFDTDSDLPDRGTDEYQAILNELNCLEDVFDSLGDISIFESIYQNIRGNYQRAPSMPDILAGSGTIMSEPESLCTRIPSVTYSQKICLLFSNDETTDLTSRLLGWYETIDVADLSPVSLSNPLIDTWVMQQIGDFSKYYVRITIDTNDPEYLPVQDVLTHQKIGPIDLLRMTPDTLESPSHELHKRIDYHTRLQNGLNNQNRVIIQYLPTSEWDGWDIANMKSLYEIHSLLLDLRSFISQSRALRYSDLILGSELEKVILDESNYHELRNRVGYPTSTNSNSLYNRFKTIREIISNPDDIDETNIQINRELLMKISLFSLPQAIPLPVFQHDEETIQRTKDHVQEILKIVDQKITQFDEKIQEIDDLYQSYIDSSSIPSERNKDMLLKVMSGLSNVSKLLLGENFTILTHWSILNGTELQLGSNTTELLGGNDPGYLDYWMYEIGATHPKIKVLTDIFLLNEEINGAPPPNYSIIQLPYDPDKKWLGLEQEITEELGEYLSLVIVNDMNFGYDPTKNRISGIIIDEWTEKIPLREVQAGISFHFNRPNTEAPQVLLLCIPPVIKTTEIERTEITGSWTWDHIKNSVNEALSLAKIRAVDLDAMTNFGTYLPALFAPVMPYVEPENPEDI